MKIEPSVVAFDIDGVVADTMSLFLLIARTEYGINHTRYDDIVDYDLGKCLDIGNDVMMEILIKIMEGRYSLPLNPIPDAPRVLRRLNDCHQPTLFVTARPEGAYIRDWICESLGLQSNTIEVVATGSFEGKREILEEHRIRFFVEDRLETCFVLAEAGITPILFKQPWNRKSHPFTEVDNWEGIESLLRLQ
jgi:uncharacterized protein